MRRKSILLLSLSLILSVPSLVPAEEPPEEFHITDVSGDAGVQPQGSKIISPATTGLLIQPGDTIITGTGGKVQLATREGTVLEVREKSSLEISSFSERSRIFFLKVGRLLGRVAKRRPQQAAVQIRTPIAVASVRGTELVMDVQESGETQAGVVEGQVAFGTSPPIDENADPETLITEEIPVETAQGIVVRPEQKPEKMAAIPPAIVGTLNWFPPIRAQIPSFRQRLSRVDRPALLKHRHQLLKTQIRWKAPPRLERPRRPGGPPPTRKPTRPRRDR